MSGVGENVLYSGVDQTSHVDRQTDRRLSKSSRQCIAYSRQRGAKSFLTLRRHA